MQPAQNVLEVLVGNSCGPRDADLADAARRWWKGSALWGVPVRTRLRVSPDHALLHSGKAAR